MIGIRKSILAAVAIAVVGLAAAIDFAEGSAQGSTAPVTTGASAVAARFPRIDEIMVAQLVVPAQSQVVFAPKAQAPRAAPVFVPTEACVHEDWPYIADECLVARDGSKPGKPTRKIKIERRAPPPAPAVTETLLASR